MAKHLSEDEVTLVVNAKADKAQQNIRKFSKEIDNLGERNKSLQRQMESLELAGKKNTDSWKQRREEYGRNATQIRNLKQQIAAETKALDLNALTMAQLRQQARSLQRQLDNTSKTINPEDWNKLSSRLSDVRKRMGELSDASKSLVEKYSEPQTMSFFRGEMFVRFAELAGKALQKVKEFAAEGISMAESADGVIHAFSKLDQPALLDNLRKATRGTVSDIELMKAAVKAKDFRIPLEDLGKYLSFAQLKAQQTGQSLDYMVDSIVTGLGRKSPMILDNLGLSAAEIGEQTKKTGGRRNIYLRSRPRRTKNNQPAEPAARTRQGSPPVKGKGCRCLRLYEDGHHAVHSMAHHPPQSHGSPHRCRHRPYRQHDGAQRGLPRMDSTNNYRKSRHNGVGIHRNNAQGRIPPPRRGHQRHARQHNPRNGTNAPVQYRMQV